MKSITTGICAIGLTLAVCQGQGIERDGVLNPGLIAFEDLRSDDLFKTSGAREVLEGELHRTGIIQIGDIPAFAGLRSLVLQNAVKCSQVSPAASASTFEDGTVRVTMAAETTPEDGQRPMDHGDEAECKRFQMESDAFRAIVDDVARVFAKRLNQLVDVQPSTVLVKGTKKDYKSVEELANKGYHLEHFHSYMGKAESKEEDEYFVPTVDFHTDQGLYIAFVPPMMVTPDGTKLSDEPGEFFVEMETHKVLKVNFAAQGDVLVFMLGDEINRILNPKLPLSAASFRAAPHAFVMPKGYKTTVYRSWYGRMFLPPRDAFHSEEMTYAEFREKTIQASLSNDNNDVLSVGCSGSQHARELAEPSCTENQIYCWHRCMDYTEEVSPTACAEKNLGFNCTSQYNQIWLPEHGHGDYVPMCTNATSLVTPSPTISKAPDSCPPFEDFVRQVNYQGYRDLFQGIKLVWNVTEDGFLEAAMLWDGRLGWMAVGFPKEGGKRKGMHGAKIVMAIAEFGGINGSVAEYQVDEVDAAFRHWSTPLPNSLDDASLELDGNCFAAMYFRTKTIGGDSLNMAGSNSIIWGLHDTTWRVEYHGRDYRGVLDIDFRQLEPPLVESDQPSHASRTTLAISLLASMLLACAF